MNTIFKTADGFHSLTSGRFGVSYHSEHGAKTESQYVFIEAGLDHHYTRYQKPMAVFEMGFGSGLNALCAMNYAGNRDVSIDYTGVEAFPISLEEAIQLNYTEQSDEAERAAFMRMHEDNGTGAVKSLKLSPNFTFSKHICRLEDFVPSHPFDVIFYDAFGPRTQPELWEEDRMQKVYQWMNPGGVLVTYCAQGKFKRALAAVGFTVERLPGPPGKREMTRAIKI